MTRRNKALFVFRRDLRLEDNTALIEALTSSKCVLPCFIFDPRQVEPHAFFNANALQFLLESLDDLKEQLRRQGGRLYIFHGRAEDIINLLLKEEHFDAVYLNRDYTPFSVGRDLAIKRICAAHGVEFVSRGDCLLQEPEDVGKPSGGPYIVYTYFFKTAQIRPVRLPHKNTSRNYFADAVGLESKPSTRSIISEKNPRLFAHGGRGPALKILSRLKTFINYDDARNYPAQSGTTGLSCHLKFGTCSIRETYTAIKRTLGEDHTLIRELYWRDFFTHIAHHFPHVFGKSFYEEYDRIKWTGRDEHFQAWTEGRTGFPIVDAGMRELNATGFMHNRVRMITASFLVKDLHIDWRRGERYFGQKLIDYDPCVNNGNWQWAASTGCDAQPYFRIFNPWLQQQKFDPDCRYIKKWIPELENLSPPEIHRLVRTLSGAPSYPAPIIDHALESARTKAMYRRVKSS